MIDNAIREIRPATRDNIGYVIDRAKEDGNSGVIAATDVIMKEGKIIGYLGINSMPYVQVWMHTKESKIRDAMQSLTFIEGTLARQGAESVALPCHESSNYTPYLEKLGYERLNYDCVFAKKLR